MMSLSIYANATLGTGPRRPSDAPVIETRVAVTKQAEARSHFEIEVLRILAMSPGPGESVQKAFDAKEASLRAFFVTLSAEERAALHALTQDDRDPLGFGRLSAERRSRVLSALLGGRRRE
ncbi:MAG: hypothetical protein ABJE66_29395 [Deltaproteobacteria bacterium]